MATNRTRIASAVASHTLQKGASRTYAKEVAALLLAEGRIGELDSLLRDVQGAWAETGYVEVLARTAHPLSAETKKDIATQVQAAYPAANQILVTEVHDASVLGGVRINLANQQLDLSVEAKLNRFKQLTGAGKE